MKLLLSLISLIFIDIKTGEKLTGVEVICNDSSVYYSDLDGVVKIDEGEIVKRVSFISYIDIDTTFLEKPSTIYMKALENQR